MATFNQQPNTTTLPAVPAVAVASTSNQTATSTNSLLNKQLNSTTLSKALAKPPPLSSVLTLPKNALANGAGGLTTPSNLSLNSSLSSSPNVLLQQQQQMQQLQQPLQKLSQPLVGSNLIAQTKKSAELLQTQTSNGNNDLNQSSGNNGLSSSLNHSNQLPQPQINLSHSLPSNSTNNDTSAAQLFNILNNSSSNIRNTNFLDESLNKSNNHLSSSTNNFTNSNGNSLNNSLNNFSQSQSNIQQHQQPSTSQWFQNVPPQLPAYQSNVQPQVQSQQQLFQSPLHQNITPNANYQNQPTPNASQQFSQSQQSNLPDFNNMNNLNYLNSPHQYQAQMASLTNNMSQSNRSNLIGAPPTSVQTTQNFSPLNLSSASTGPLTSQLSGPPTSSLPGPPTGPLGGTSTGPLTGPPTSSIGLLSAKPMAASQIPTIASAVPPFGGPPKLNNITQPLSSQMQQHTAPPMTTTQIQQQQSNGNSLYNPARPANQPPTGPPVQLQQQKPIQQQPQLIQQQPISSKQQQQLQQQQMQQQQPLNNQFQNMSISNNNNKLNRNQPHSVDLLREKRLIQPYSDEFDEPNRPIFPHEFYTNVNCHPDTIRCTLSSIPESQSLLTKSRLPLGILIHPFKDLESLKVVQSSTIVRCRSCRSYINPFVHFLDNSKWRCNMCYSINDLPDEFLFDPVTRTYGDPSKRPEINSSTIEFIAPPEYTLRPPPPAMYLYLLDVSRNAVNTGYLSSFCETLLENIDKIPGDSRTQIGFMTYNSSLHFYNLSDSLSQPRMMIFPDLEDIVLPMPDGLMINLNENKESVQMFLQSLPTLFADTYETDSALGTALNAAFQLLKQTGGRITIMQTCLPNLGVGSLKAREENIDKDPANMAPQTDFYKKLALDCAGVQIAVDLFMFNSLYADLATLSCVSKYSGGEIKYYPRFHHDEHPEQVVRFCVDFKRYITRKIGFEAVMRIRCTRGLAIHTFHGNFFVRSTDLLALPNVNPDAGFGMQVTIEESLTDIPTVCFQAAVLYTSSKSERRIRIHTYCLPVTKSMNEIVNGADQEAVIGLIAKMAVDRTAMNSLKEAKDAMVNVAIDYLQAYGQHVVSAQRNNSLISPYSLRLIPMYILSLMKNIAFKFGNIKMDDRVYAMNLCKTMPLKYLMLCIYPHLFAIHNLDDKKVIVDSSEAEICIPPRLQLSSESIDRHGVYIMDCGEAIYMWIGRSVSDLFLQQVFDCKSFHELPDHSSDLPELDNELSERIRNFLVYLYDSRPFGPTFLFFREDSPKSALFFQQMHEDKTESSLSYYEFLRHLNDQINN